MGWALNWAGYESKTIFEKAATHAAEYCFPNRLEAIQALECAQKLNPTDAKAPYYLGNLWYDKRQYAEAIACWEKSVEIDDTFPTVLRNLSLAYFNKLQQKDKALEYGKDIWMKYTLPTQHIIYFGIQVKKGKLDSSGVSKASNHNIAEIYNQTTMMLGHEIFDPETNKRVLVDHAYIIAGGEITKAARNWLGNKLDANRRSQIIFMDRDDILNLFTVNVIEVPQIH